ncbi:hypothetical protein [Robiginitalea sediminis]|uniref:hypothetical protein n=1 Tax=Robiginitalea sediminis TaxID=1982593 RepID=UPI00117A31AE|nr:hypothetical protein [Robiginitalea sediminis]
MVQRFKQFIVRTPLHRMAIEMKAYWISRNWVRENDKILNNKTVYCISPYKTGTTFLASSFDDAVSMHEPLHFTSIRKLNENFGKYFVRRLNSLDLKLECSGFLSAYVEELAKDPVARELTYICVLRKPSAWATSVVNHHQVVKEGRQHFFWGNELFWKEHVGVDLANFFHFNDTEKQQLVENLISYYMDFTEKTRALRNVHYVWLQDLKDFLPEVGGMIGEVPKLEKSRQNKARKHAFVYENEEVDLAYEQLINDLRAAV